MKISDDQIVIYKSEDGKTAIDVRLENESDVISSVVADKSVL